MNNRSKHWRLFIWRLHTKRAGNFDRAVDSLNQYASTLLSMGSVVEAKDCFEYALAALKTWPDQFHEARFYLTTSLATTYTRFGDGKKAGEALARAWDLLPHAFKQQSLVESNVAIAGLCSIEGQICSLNLQWAKQLEFAQKRYVVVSQFA